MLEFSAQPTFVLICERFPEIDPDVLSVSFAEGFFCPFLTFGTCIWNEHLRRRVILMESLFFSANSHFPHFYKAYSILEKFTGAYYSFQSRDIIRHGN